MYYRGFSNDQHRGPIFNIPNIAIVTHTSTIAQDDVGNDIGLSSTAYLEPFGSPGVEESASTIRDPTARGPQC